MFERFNDQARQVVILAFHFARKSGSPSIETEHLLLGLMEADRPRALGFLKSEEGVAEVRAQLGAPEPYEPGAAESGAGLGERPLSRESKRGFEYAAAGK